MKAHEKHPPLNNMRVVLSTFSVFLLTFAAASLIEQQHTFIADGKRLEKEENLLLRKFSTLFSSQ